MTTRRTLSLLLAAGALATVPACASADDGGRGPAATADADAAAGEGSATTASATGTALGKPAQAARRGITITTRSVGGFGKILVDGRGMPLYVFTADRGTTSRCDGDCAKAWPVTFAKGTPRAKGGARQSLIGTTKRRDGRLQATYRGRPLYYYVDDRAGVALCHDVREFGGLWLLVKGDGRRVR